MRVLIASDIHANIEPMRKILSESSYDYSMFLGDIVDYGTRPSETLDLVRSNFDRVVQGNHDNAAAFGVDCMCGQENHELSVYTREEITNNDLGKEDIRYLQSLKTSDEFELDGIKMTLAHGSPRNALYEYVYPWNVSADMFRTPLGQPLEHGLFFVGHTHYQFYTQLKGYTVINPGSSGQPRDNDSRPSFCIYDTETGSVELKRIRYDSTSLKNEIVSSIKDEKMRNLNLRLFRLI